MIRVLVAEDNPILHRVADPYELNLDGHHETLCEAITRRELLLNIVHDLWDTLDDQIGYGLAAPQIGWPFQMFVLRTPNKKLTVINPRIRSVSDQTEVDSEGCLSYPNRRVDVRRAVRIKVAYHDEDRKPWSHYLNGLDARVFLHEYDHTQGVVMHDREET